VTSFHHQPEAQHPKSSAIHKLPADYPIFRGKSGHHSSRASCLLLTQSGHWTPKSRNGVDGMSVPITPP
jgi:hypothetical protein